MGPMRSGSNVGLPEGHWLHKVIAKETKRASKKKSTATGHEVGQSEHTVGSMASGGMPMSEKMPVASGLNTKRME